VAKVGSNLKPTLIEENQNGILVNKNILCLNVKPEYENQALAITKSMNEPEFAERIAAITIGTGVPQRANKDILDLPFRIHEFEGFESSEKKDIYEYAGDLYGLFRHDFSQPVSTLSLQYSILRKTLLKIIDSDVLSQKVKKTGKSLEELINDPAVQIKRISQILKANENLHTGVLQPQVCSLRELINESFREFNHDLLKNMSFEVRGDIEQRIDPDQIKLLFTNLIKNAVHHGGSGDINLLFELKEIEEEGMLEIRYFNNGDPFPTNFSIKDYVQPQSKGDNSNGSGHGGFIIQKVAMNHNGTVDQIWNESVPKYFNEEDGNTYNVYLHITLRPIK
jgi:signal transduction histidine kinase